MAKARILRLGRSTAGPHTYYYGADKIGTVCRAAPEAKPAEWCAEDLDGEQHETVLLPDAGKWLVNQWLRKTGESR